MEKYIWILPAVFMFHDMEEITGIEKWYNKNCDSIISAYPSAAKVLSTYKGITTAGFALAVYEELVILIGICIAASLTDSSLVKGLWFGSLLGFTMHLVIHIVQAALIRRYIPALITSIISLPPSICITWKCCAAAPSGSVFIAGTVIGITGIAVNLKFAHKLMKRI